MIYDHAVKAFGKFYAAGEEVPDVIPDSEPESTEAEQEKPKRTRKASPEETV